VNASDPHQYGSASGCLALRQIKLKSAIEGKEKELVSIRVSHEKRESLAIKAIESFNKAKKQLKNAKDEGGYDKLGITQNLIKKLNIDIKLNSVEDSKLFAELPPKEELKDVLVKSFDAKIKKPSLTTNNIKKKGCTDKEISQPKMMINSPKIPFFTGLEVFDGSGDLEQISGKIRATPGS